MEAESKYTATWVSHTSITDFLKCPRAYYLKNVYKNPQTGRKMQVMAPSLALGQAVHEVLESLSILPTDRRFMEPLFPKYETAWQKVSGKRGGFCDDEQEKLYKNRGMEMLKRVVKNPGPLANKAVKLKAELPNFWLSEDDSIILCGKIDWLEYFPESDSVHIIDFKTSKKQEDDASLQLPIYRLLVANCQKRKTEKASYWYLDFSDTLHECSLPDLDDAYETILKVAKQIKLARQLKLFKCIQEGDCVYCAPFEAILRGEAEHVGVNDFGQDIYILQKSQYDIDDDDSIVL